MPTEVHTICFHTRDAVEREDSRMVFELPVHRLRNPAVKVALGSVEFPMVQWTVEEEWSRLWINEGIRLTSGGNKLQFSIRLPGGTDPEYTNDIGVPVRLNPIVGVRRVEGGFLDFECSEPHFLWANDGSSCLVKRMATWGCDVRVVAGVGGDISIRAAFEDGHLHRISDTTFRVGGITSAPVGDVAWASRQAFLLVDVIPSPHHLCELLTFAARGTAFVYGDEGSVDGSTQGVASVGQEIRFQYNKKKDEVAVHLRFPERTLVRVVPGALAKMLGLSSTVIRTSETVSSLATGPTNMWDYVEIPTGFYSPCHRSMSTGQPLRFGTEVESAINRLYFPLPSTGDNRLQASPSTPHTIVFVDPWARTNMCPIPCGRYTPLSICSYLETEMTRISGKDVTFSVFYSEDRFVFSCERTSDSGRVEAAPFSLLFNHPICTDAARFGFPPQPCVGATTYTSITPVHFPRTDGFVGSEPRAVGNLIRVSEITSQKRFRVHAMSVPTMTAVVTAKKEGTVVLRTYVNRLPYSHGYQLGDVVRVVATDDGMVALEVTNSENTQWKEVEYAAAPAFPFDVTAVVVQSSVNDPTVLMLLMPDVAEVDTSVSIIAIGPDPWNMCFCECKPKSIDAYMLGFPSQTILWGIDGSLHNGAIMVPPFDAPFVHSLDHPDYVLITLNESAGASLEHNYNGESKHVFCKLSLYPLFREERMLPRDSNLARGTFSRFEIAFWNPDMRRPYKFHGAEFSFSLNFISGVPGD